jgi:ferredoxin-thioredoxin reductase catalytic subunit
MEISVVDHLLRTETKLKCKFNTGNPEFENTVMHMIKTKTEKGNARCPCVADGSVFCPCKPWVQAVKTDVAKPGDMCHCELFVKV